MDTSPSHTHWRKSTYSNGNGGNCIETTNPTPGHIAIRDSKNPSGQPLTLTATAWQTLTEHIKRGRPVYRWT